MRLYHYSVDSFQGGKSLRNDFKGQYRYAETFLLALRQGRDIFTAAYFSAMYLSRELVSLKLRKYENYRKDAVEAIFEYVRETEFADQPGRLRCVYYCRSREEAAAYAEDDCLADGSFTKEQVRLFEVEADEKRVREYDQAYYNHALSALERNAFDTVFADARSYYSMERTENPLIEVVSDGENEVIGELSY